MTPQWIQKFSHKIRSAPVVMVDANLNPQALKAACQRMLHHLQSSFFHLSEVMYFPTNRNLMAIASIIYSLYFVLNSGILDLCLKMWSNFYVFL